MALRKTVLALAFVAPLFAAGIAQSAEKGELGVEVFCYPDEATGQIVCEFFSETAELVATCRDIEGYKVLVQGKYNLFFRNCSTFVTENPKSPDQFERLFALLGVEFPGGRGLDQTTLPNILQNTTSDAAQNTVPFTSPSAPVQLTP